MYSNCAESSTIFDLKLSFLEALAGSFVSASSPLTKA